jgi:hypothetical protein
MRHAEINVDQVKGDVEPADEYAFFCKKGNDRGTQEKDSSYFRSALEMVYFVKGWMLCII